MNVVCFIFAWIFYRIFHGKWLPKWSKKYLGIDSFGDIFRMSSFWYILVVLCLILVAPWLTFGSLLAPLGCLLVPFGFLLAHFWCPLAHFWCPWDHFCSPLRSMFTLLRSPGVIFNSFWIFRWVSYVNSYFFEKSSLKFSLFVFMFLKYFRQQAKHPKTIPGTLAFALHHLSGPERKLAAGNLCFKGLLFNHGVGGIA